MSKSHRKVIAQAPQRSCGACHACCVLPPVVAAGWEKAAGERCRHLTEAGQCGVYADRPPTCRHFQCAWLAGRLPFETEWRPDRLGLLLTGMAVNGETLLYAYEVWKGASQSHPAARDLLEQLVATQFVIIVDTHPPAPSTRAAGPPALHEAFTRRHGGVPVGGSPGAAAP